MKIALFIVLATFSGVALAEPPAKEQPKPPAKAVSAPPSTAEMPREKKVLLRQLRDEREKMVRERGDVFAKITTKHDYSGEYVLFRDADVTAFLDLKDPRHPRYKPGHDEDDGAPADVKRRAYLLVVPNQPREAIGKTLSSDITAEDLELTLKIMRAGAALAGRLGIKNPRIFVKSPGRVGVGYLHIHVVGERDPNRPYPPPLQ